MYLFLKRMKVVAEHVTKDPKQPREKVKQNTLKAKNVKAKELTAKKMANPVLAPKR